MLATLLDGVAPGQTRPTRQDTAELLAGAIRERLGIHAVPGFAAGLRIAGPIAFVLAAGFATSDWIQGHRTPLAAVVTAVLAVAVFARVVRPRTGSVATVLAWITTVGVVVAVNAAQAAMMFEPARLLVVGEAPSRYLIELAFGLIAVLAALLPQTRSSLVERLAEPAAVAGLLAVTLIMEVNPRPAMGYVLPPYPSWTEYAWFVPAAILVAGLVVVVLRRQTALLWAGALLLAPMPATVDGTRLLGHLSDMRIVDLIQFLVPRTTQVVLLSAALVTMVALAAAHQTAPFPRDGEAAVARAGAVCLGVAAGVCMPTFAFQLTWHGAGSSHATLVLLALPVVVAPIAMLLPPALGRYAIGVAAAIMCLTVLSGEYAIGYRAMLGAAALLLVVAAAIGSEVRAWVGIAALASAGLVASVSYAEIGMGWFGGWAVMPAAALAPALALAVLLPTLWWTTVMAVLRLRRNTANA
jgi:hypothetical protein